MGDKPNIAERCLHHADAILRASGSRLANYTMPKTRNAILSATIDMWEEAYRAGAVMAQEHFEKSPKHPMSDHERN